MVDPIAKPVRGRPKSINSAVTKAVKTSASAKSGSPIATTTRSTTSPKVESPKVEIAIAPALMAAGSLAPSAKHAAPKPAVPKPAAPKPAAALAATSSQPPVKAGAVAVPEAVPEPVAPLPVETKPLAAASEAIEPVAAPFIPLPETVALPIVAEPEIVLPIVAINPVVIDETSEVLAKQVAQTEILPNATAFNEATVKTLMKVNEVVSRGVEDISKELISHSWTALEQAAAAMSKMISAKTLRDVLAVNVDLQQRQYDTLVETTTRLGALTAKLVTDSAGPLSARAKSLVSGSHL